MEAASDHHGKTKKPAEITSQPGSGSLTTRKVLTRYSGRLEDEERSIQHVVGQEEEWIAKIGGLRSGGISGIRGI